MAGTSAQTAADLTGYLNSVNPEQTYASAGQGVGLPAAQQQVAGLRQAIGNTTGLLTQLAPQVMGDAAHSLQSTAQSSRVIQNRSAPIQGTLAKQTQDYGGASADFNTRQGQANSLAGATLGDQKTRTSYLQNVLSDLSKQEQDAATNAENARQFNATQAEQRRQANVTAAQAKRASSSGGGGGGRSSGGSSGGSSGRPTIAQVVDYYVNADSQYGPYNPHGTNNHRWQAAADELKSMGFDTGHGSAADRALQAAFARQGK